MLAVCYTRNHRVDDCLAHFSERLGPDDRIRGANGAAFVSGQIADCDLALIDDDFPQIADEYRAAGVEVELFRFDELGEEPPEEADASELDEQAFASPTAFDVAVEAGLGPEDFDPHEPAGKTGYTTAQVRELAGG